MSCLDYPRFHFNGTFSTNVCTANNDDMNNVSNRGAIADEYYPIVDPVTAALNPNIAKMTRDQARAWFGSKSAGSSSPNAGWNYYGDHVVKFENTAVSAVQTSASSSKQLATALVGTQVSLPGAPKMVDVDPTGSVNTQIFLGGFSLGTSSTGITYSNAKHRDGVVGYTRWIGGRNISVGGFTSAAATWQFGIPKGDQLTFAGTDGDPALNLLMQRAEAAKGLLVQFCVYFAKPLISSEQLIADFANGLSTQNPAVGHMVGTVGIWDDDDFATLPNGRLLNPTRRNKVPVGPAVAKAHSDQGVISLNLITTFPEQIASQPDDENVSTRVRAMDNSAFPPLQKVPLGDLTLAVQTSDGTVKELGPLTGYDDYDAYLANAGILDVKLVDGAPDPAQGDLVIIDASGKTRLQEQPLVAETDDHAIYMTQGEVADVQVNVRLRGNPIGGNATLTVTQSPSTYGFNSNEFPDIFNPPSDAASASFDSAISGDGILTGKITADKNPALLLLDCSLQTDASPGDTADFSISLRIHSDETFTDKPAGDYTWQEVYDIALKYYDYVFPAMSEILDLSDEGLVVSQSGAFLFLLETDFKNPQYMPVTRSLSPGRRQLLIDWLSARAGV